MIILHFSPFILCSVLFVLQSRVDASHCAEDKSVEMSVAEIFQQNEVVPDVIDAAPKALAEITYPNGDTVRTGNELFPTNVKDLPTIKWNAEPDALYTLIMTDPDAPNRQEPKFREVRHWLIVNVPGDNISAGETLFEFIGSGPPQGSGLHRYVFLIYKQDGKLDVSEEPRTTNRSRDRRLNSSARDFAKKYNLTDLVAGNFYQAQYDDYVPLLHKQLSGV